MPEKKKVLVFIDWFLPGDKSGGPVRSCVNMMEHLGNEFDFSVVTRDTDYTEKIPYKNIQPDAWNILPDGKRVYYISAAELKRKTVSRLLAEEEYDAVHLNGIWSLPFTTWPLLELKKSRHKKKVIISVRGMFAPSAMAIKPLKKKIFLRWAFLKKLYADAVFHATSESEKNDVLKVIGSNANVRVAGNLPRKNFAKAVILHEKRTPLHIVNVARIAPEKNTLFALEVLKLVNVPFIADFFGPVYDTEYWKKCETFVKNFPADCRVNFRGALASAEIGQVFSAYDLFFLPSRGENFGHVILEAMQSGLPVLVSDQTPWKNLAVEKAGWDISLASPENFSRKIVEIAGMTSTEFSQWQEGALKLATRYSGSRELAEANRQLFS